MIFWHLLQSLHIAVWVYALYTALSIQTSESWILFSIFFLINLLQFLFISDDIGRDRGFSGGQSFVMTILLGFSWWYPLKQKKEF
ncbi:MULTISPECIES: hypothetical protein [unclassified Oceanispirochaeta]|uniref:hypothetical protein n=1 Tax=unclassified Oceanispirochaeta TaxID=2635722 RepID=UPI000E091255|nr:MULTISPECIES: hypothetical protein [unclassified Oceanispirochaeta]MBF9015429.1 hypothetical protein [Oceanispirochaeta sp. M2]NPD71888.1 hypothetical protein [Oceanispirochaeta sp. M1]RDG32696.1 hypothetical protein DV872_07235 [Oceanispirochaeta sp. M1]